MIPTRPKPKPQPRPVRRQLALAATSCILALGVVELFLRAFSLPAEHSGFAFQGPEFEDGRSFIKDPDLFWKLRPGLEHLDTNHLFLRGWAPRSEKGPRDLRIACVGDSCTFGIEVDYEDAYGIQLENRLRRIAPNANVETVLAGVPGYSTYQDCILFDTKLKDLRPDVTVLYCGAWNDYLGAVGSNDAQFGRELEELRTSWIYKLHLARLVRAVLVRRHADAEAFARGEFPDGHRVPIPDFQENLNRLIDRGRENGGLVVAVVPPIPKETLERIRFGRDYRTAMQEVYEKRGVPFVDTPRAFSGARTRLQQAWGDRPGKPPALFLDFVHPSPLGYEIIAGELERLIVRSLPRLGALAKLEPAGSIRVDGVDPGESPTLRENATIHVIGRGFNSGIERVWVGHTWIRRFRIESDSKLTFVLPTRLVRSPGSHKVTLLTRSGSVVSPVDLRVTAIPLEASLQRQGDRLLLTARVHGHPTLKVILWRSTAALPSPYPSRVGDFWLPEGVLDPDLPWRRIPYRFDLLDPMGRMEGVVRPDGKAVLEQLLPASASAPAPVHYLQGIVYWGGTHHEGGVATSRARLAAPR